MAYYRTRGLRGSTLEEMVNMANEIYRKEGIALIQKIPTPIKPVEFDSERRTISLAYFEQRSTVDYMGILQGIPICFDAKETAQRNLPVANIHPHQVEFMREFDRQGGLTFLLVHFSADDMYYLLPFEVLNTYSIRKESTREPRPFPGRSSRNGFGFRSIQGASPCTISRQY